MIRTGSDGEGAWPSMRKKGGACLWGGALWAEPPCSVSHKG